MARRLTERAHAAVELVQRNPVRFVDHMFFFLGTLASAWLAFLLVFELVTAGWRHIWVFIPFWILVAYLLLPRVHSLLARVYVPNYFIGRSRTREGLLGDPVNLAFRADIEQLHAAMLRAGWQRADEINLHSGARMVLATLTRRSYPGGPVSPLFVFGQRQAFTYQQQVQGNPAKRHHIRFWQCPTGWRLPGGKQVEWLAAATYDRSVGFSHFTLQVTHRISANIDAERDHVLASLTGPESGNRPVKIHHLRHFTTGYHDRNGGGDRIRTDGDLPIIDLRRIRRADKQVKAKIAADDWENKRGTALPLTVALGLALMAARVVLGIASLTLLAKTSVPAIGSLALVAPLVQWGIPAVVVAVMIRVVLIAYLLAYLVLAWFIYRRSNRARTIALAISMISIATYVALWLTGAPSSTLATQIFGSALEILVVLAFTGETARTFTTDLAEAVTAQRASS